MEAFLKLPEDLASKKVHLNQLKLVDAHKKKDHDKVCFTCMVDMDQVGDELISNENLKSLSIV
jgi:hypothetical protein